MPKARKRRKSQHEMTFQALIQDRKYECLCLLNGLCVCRQKEDTPPIEDGVSSDAIQSVWGEVPLDHAISNDANGKAQEDTESE